MKGLRTGLIRLLSDRRVFAMAGMHQLCVAYLMLNAIGVAVNAIPLQQKIVDLTHPFDENTLTFPDPNNPTKFKLEIVIVYPYGNRVQSEKFSSGTHVGTHIDAPAHFYPGAATVDQFPLEQLIGPAAVVNIEARATQDPDTELMVEDLIQWEAATGQTLNDTIVLMNSGWGKRWNNQTLYQGTPENDIYKVHFPGISPEAALWMVTKRKVRGAGVDTLSFDRGQTREYMSHKTFLGDGRFILENVANLESIPVFGATLDVKPMKIANAGGAPVRLTATYPELRSEF